MLHSYIIYLHHHPHMGAIITFTLAFLESLAIVGSIIPGSITMTALGMLIGTHILSGPVTFISAALGAMVGDYISYCIGAHYQRHIQAMWPFRHYTHWLETGQRFIKNHGGKSIIIARFFGPMRSLAPLIAGMLKMKRTHFILAVIPSATLWSLVYLTPGVLLGALSIHLPTKLATQFLLLALLISALIWLTIWIIERSFYTITHTLNNQFLMLWQQCQKQPLLTKIQYQLSPTFYPQGHNQLARLTYLLLMSLILGSITWSVAHNGLITLPNQPLYYLFSSLKTTLGTHIMLAITLPANKFVLTASSLIISIWLFWQGHRRSAYYLLMLCILSAILIYGLKVSTHFPRPNNLPGYSFPSGHIGLFTSLVSFLTVLINDALVTPKKNITYHLGALLTIMIALSRLYLGAHWFSDVLASLCLGIACTLFILILYYRKATLPIPPRPFIAVICSALILSTTIYAKYQYTALYETYKPHTSITFESAQKWWQHGYTALPIYRPNRFGQPSQPFNIQWAGTLKDIRHILTQTGWQSQKVKPKLTVLLTRLTAKKDTIQLPILPLKYKHHTPVLLMTKLLQQPTHTSKSPHSPKMTSHTSKQPITHPEILIIRLWPSHVILTPNQTRLWIGTLQYYIPTYHPTKGLFTSFKKPLNHSTTQTSLFNTIHLLIHNLKRTSTRWKIWSIPKNQHTDLPYYQWDNLVLLINDL